MLRPPSSRGAASRQRRPSETNTASSGVLLVVHVGPVDDLAVLDHVAQEGARDRAAAARREGRLRSGAGGCDHARNPVVGEHDRRSVERDEPAELPDERGESLLDLERRAERAGAAVRGVEEVDPPAKLVAELLGLLGAGLRDGRLTREAGLTSQPMARP